MMASDALAPSGPILAISGSTRTGSLNRALLSTAVGYLNARGVACNLRSLDDFAMPFYNGDIEKKDGLPPGARALRAEIERSAALLICTPEYNGSIPAILKNAIDWTSRPFEGAPATQIFRQKVVCLMGASAGDKGALRGLAHLSSVFMNMGALVMPRFFGLSHAASAFNEAGSLADPRLQKTLETYLDGLAASLARGAAQTSIS